MINQERLKQIITEVNKWLAVSSQASCWQKACNELLMANDPIELHYLVYQHIYKDKELHESPQPVWYPDDRTKADSNCYKVMQELGLSTVQQLHDYSVSDLQYWQLIMDKLQIKFTQQPSALCNITDLTCPSWLIDGSLNIANSCFNSAPERTAVIYQQQGKIIRFSYQQLDSASNQVANSLVKLGLNAGDKIAIALPMNIISVSIYIGIIKFGGVVVSIADSFAANEIKKRLNIAKCKLIFTQDKIVRMNKSINLYEKVLQAEPPQAIVTNLSNKTDLRAGDVCYSTFLIENKEFSPVICKPHDPINILFSSGTTGNPKAIPWDHTSAIKAAADGFMHQDIKPNDVVAWPSNLGWMMGPWLLFAGFINRATIAIYEDAPTTEEFLQYVAKAEITILGVVPSIVKAWHKHFDKAYLRKVRLFSSTGESSNFSDMFYLMAAAGYKPIIEYCGGTEISGGYITSTVLKPSIPSTFNCKAFGLDFTLINKSDNQGEVALIPPSMGLSRTLLNKDHYQEYYADMPGDQVLRRHGDQLELLNNGYYRALGRVDDTMNLGGIKVSSAEIERVLLNVDGIVEVAAIAVPVDNSSALIIYVVSKQNTDLIQLKSNMQQAISKQLNPLFKIYAVEPINKLPRTSSNKIMRRALRDSYHKDKGRI